MPPAVIAFRARPLLVVAVVLLAGCSGVPDDPATGGPSTETPSPPVTATSVTATPTDTPTVTGSYRKFIFEAVPATDETVGARYATALADRSPGEDRGLQRSLQANGSATRTAFAARPAHGPLRSAGPVENGTLVTDGDTYWRVHATVERRRNATGYRMRLEGPVSSRNDDYGDIARSAVDLANLTAPDRAAVRHLLPPAAVRRSGQTSRQRRYAFDAGGEASSELLADGPHYVRLEGDYYVVEAGEQVPVTVVRLRYDLRPVANSTAEFAADVRDRHAFEFPGDRRSEDTGVGKLSDRAQTLLARALETGSVSRRLEPGSSRTAFHELNRWVYERGPSERTALVRYRGRAFLVSVTEEYATAPPSESLNPGTPEPRSNERRGGARRPRVAARPPPGAGYR